MAKKDQETPPPEGATPGEVDPATAAKAKAEVDAARAKPVVQAEVIGNVKRGRGRPKGSTNKPKAEKVVQDQDEDDDPAEPADFEEWVDLFNSLCVSNGVEPIPEEDGRRWSRKAAKVANRWGGSIPLMPEVSLIVGTVMIFGPRAAVMLDPEHQARVKAWKAAQDEERMRAEEKAKSA